MIEVKNISKRYGDKTIFDGVSCTLDNDKIYALVGVNGIGKSTLLNAMTQPAGMDSGWVKIDGIDSSDFESKRHFFFVPDRKDMFLNLTGFEYLRFIWQLYRESSTDFERSLHELSVRFKLESSLNEYIANYSLGMKQKIYLIAAFLSGAKNLILDEPFNGLDPVSAAVLKAFLKECRTEGKMILFSIHNLDLAANFCDEVVFIDRSHRIFMAENPRDFEQLEAVFFQNCV